MKTVPNVRAGAVSGLDHQPLNQAAPTGVPEEATRVNDVLSWVRAGADDQERYARAQAALAAEREEEIPRVTLVEPLEALVEAYEADDGA